MSSKMAQAYAWCLVLQLISYLMSTKASLLLPPSLVPLDSPEGERMLRESLQVEDYFQLSQHFVTQVNGAFCGVASSVMILNALNVPRPLQEGFPAYYAYFTQENVFNNDTETVVQKATVMQQGLSLKELALFLAAHDSVETSYQYTDTTNLTLQQFKTSLITALIQPNAFAIVNFLRSAVAEVGGGHHSPIAAYHHATDYVLVLDVSRYKYPAFWVPLHVLYNSTAAYDGNLPRGLVFVWSGKLDAVPVDEKALSGEPNISYLDNKRGNPAGMVAAVSIPLFFCGLILGSIATWFLQRRTVYTPASKHDTDEELGVMGGNRKTTF